MSFVVVDTVVGTAWVRNTDGSLSVIEKGMQIPKNVEIVTGANSRVVLLDDNQPILTIGENREFLLADDIFATDVDAIAASIDSTTTQDPAVAQVLAALAAGDDPFEVLEATAAVLTGAGGDDGGSSFSRLLSIVETTSPLALAYPRPNVGTPDLERLGGVAGAAVEGDDDGGLITDDAPIIPETPVVPQEPIVPEEPVTPIEPEPEVPTPIPPVTPPVDPSIPLTPLEPDDTAPVIGDIEAAGHEDLTPDIDKPTDTKPIEINLFSKTEDTDIEYFIITKLPENGVLKIGDMIITVNLRVNLDDAKNITFIPTKDWSGDTSFGYQAMDKGGNPSDPAEVNIGVIAVTDIPTVTLGIGEVTGQVQKINVSTLNAGDNDQNFTVNVFNRTSENSPWKSAEMSIIEYKHPLDGKGAVNGFGVKGKAFEPNDSKATEEIDSNEKVEVIFTQPVTDLKVSFSWLSSTETAKYTVYGEDDKMLGSREVKGISDEIDDPYSISDQFPGQKITRVEFTSSGEKSDYVIHEITYTIPDTTIYPLEIKARTEDTDGSEQITSVVVKVPTGVKISHGKHLTELDKDGFSYYELSLVSDEGYTVTSLKTEDDKRNGFDIKGVTVTAPTGMKFEIEVIAKAQEFDGENFLGEKEYGIGKLSLSSETDPAPDCNGNVICSTDYLGFSSDEGNDFEGKLNTGSEVAFGEYMEFSIRLNTIEKRGDTYFVAGQNGKEVATQKLAGESDYIKLSIHASDKIIGGSGQKTGIVTATDVVVNGAILQGESQAEGGDPELIRGTGNNQESFLYVRADVWHKYVESGITVNVLHDGGQDFSESQWKLGARYEPDYKNVEQYPFDQHPKNGADFEDGSSVMKEDHDFQYAFSEAVVLKSEKDSGEELVSKKEEADESRLFLTSTSGDDDLFGNSDDNTFTWNKGDKGTDTVTNFGLGKDKLDLADLLIGEEEGDLANYLRLEQRDADTVLTVRSTGNLAKDPDQTIILQDTQLSKLVSEGIDLQDQNAMINDLINQGKLHVDS